MNLLEIFRRTVMTMLAVVILVALSQNSFAQFSQKQAKTLQKEREKEYKKKISDYKAKGWELAGGSRTLEVALLEHYEKMADTQNKELVGAVSQCKSMNACRQGALINAQNYYASLASANVKGRVEALLRQDDNVPENEISKFIAAYEKAVQAEVSGALTESYSIIKENGNGTNSFQTIFIVNEEKASLARKKAMERSLMETKITIKEAEEISKFVEEGFKTE